MRWVTSVNVACGGHAGDAVSMTRCVRWARERGVRIGAHPGPWSRDDLGRRAVAPSATDLRLLLLHQVGSLETVVRRCQGRMRHIKLHGALYHAVEADGDLARAYLETAMEFWPRARVIVRSGGRVSALAKKLGALFWEEVFADRAYRDDGTLMSRHRSDAVLMAVTEWRTRLETLGRGQVIAEGGRRLSLRFDTVCVHSDSPNAVRIAREAARRLGIADTENGA
jgi:UPF0271 protein